MDVGYLPEHGGGARSRWQLTMVRSLLTVVDLNRMTACRSSRPVATWLFQPRLAAVLLVEMPRRAEKRTDRAKSRVDTDVNSVNLHASRKIRTEIQCFLLILGGDGNLQGLAPWCSIFL